MNRRKVLLIVAALVAALGTAVVFLYVRGADSRARGSMPRLGTVEGYSVGEWKVSRDEVAASHRQAGLL